ncbi:hypothetical protein J421_4205 [Gemmatirosa kalamazoonensis]|uniref:Uncharacterized protein n=1 Tax=Gemmatirosa kalamazoonensis TaxID=861299 RepID=W0RMQ1_9BACT|nr:hypothetical protein [Gemmatirosa kalamazoonensis]AHG91742.1 hypothetical protein J421_4205 [Gemmatirosa kalamazoonensis]
MRLPALPTLLFVAGTVLLLLWNIVYAGRIAQLRRAPRPLATLSALCGFLVAPALVARLASSTVLGGHAVAAVAWLWPLTTLMFVAQAAYATLRRYVTPLVGVPLLAYDVLVAGVALTQWVLRVGGPMPTPLVALTAAQASVLGTLVGRAALVVPFIVPVPIIVPAYPARSRTRRVARAALAAAAAFTAGVTLLELPRGFGVVGSYLPYSQERLSERPAGDFMIGVKLLPTLDGLPPAPAVRDAVPLSDTLDLDAVSLTLRPQALSLTALDSLSKLLEPLRRDSMVIVVAIGFDDTDRDALRDGPERFLARRMSAVDRVARALRPDVLLPAEAPYGAGTDAIGAQSVEFWRAYYTAAAARAHAVNRRIRVALAASRYDAADSALFAWASTRGSPVDVLGFFVRPSFSGGAGVDARLRAADRWMRLDAARPDAPTRPKPHWVFDVRAYPMAHGDASQERTVWHTLAWATAHPQVVGVIVAEPDDYLTMNGLRAASGRFRPAVTAMGRAARGLRETVTQ